MADRNILNDDFICVEDDEDFDFSAGSDDERAEMEEELLGQMIAEEEDKSEEPEEPEEPSVASDTSEPSEPSDTSEPIEPIEPIEPSTPSDKGAVELRLFDDDI